MYTLAVSVRAAAPALPAGGHVTSARLGRRPRPGDGIWLPLPRSRVPRRAMVYLGAAQARMTAMHAWPRRFASLAMALLVLISLRRRLWRATDSPAGAL